MLLLRKLHLYLGTLFAPAIIFFAVSGMLQVLGVHESEDAEAAQPPRWIVTLASIHKDQRLSRPKPQNVPGAIEQMRADHANESEHDHADGHDHDHDHDHANGSDDKGAPEAAAWSQKLLKAFVLLMALGLIASAVMGIIIALNNQRTRRTAIVMMLAGMLLPLGLLAV